VSGYVAERLATEVVIERLRALLDHSEVLAPRMSRRFFEVDRSVQAGIDEYRRCADRVLDGGPLRRPLLLARARRRAEALRRTAAELERHALCTQRVR
jgi:hypothetical protein